MEMGHRVAGDLRVVSGPAQLPAAFLEERRAALDKVRFGQDALEISGPAAEPWPVLERPELLQQRSVNWPLRAFASQACPLVRAPRSAQVGAMVLPVFVVQQQEPLPFLQPQEHQQVLLAMQRDVREHPQETSQLARLPG